MKCVSLFYSDDWDCCLAYNTGRRAWQYTKLSRNPLHTASWATSTGHHSSEMFYNNNPQLPLKPLYHCNNCGRDNHSASQCFAPGWGLAACPTWRSNLPPHNSNMNVHTPTPKPPFPSNNPTTSLPEKQFSDVVAQPTDKNSSDLIMIASLTDGPGIKVEYDDPISIPLTDRGAHIWLINSATSGHLWWHFSVPHHRTDWSHHYWNS